MLAYLGVEGQDSGGRAVGGVCGDDLSGVHGSVVVGAGSGGGGVGGSSGNAGKAEDDGGGELHFERGVVCWLEIGLERWKERLNECDWSECG